MKRTMCRSKIHRATVTDANLDAKGARFETYAMRGAAGSGDLVINGRAARLVQAGADAIIFSYAGYDEAELGDFALAFVFVDAHNRRTPSATRRTA